MYFGELRRAADLGKVATVLGELGDAVAKRLDTSSRGHNEDGPSLPQMQSATARSLLKALGWDDTVANRCHPGVLALSQHPKMGGVRFSAANHGRIVEALEAAVREAGGQERNPADGRIAALDSEDSIALMAFYIDKAVSGDDVKNVLSKIDRARLVAEDVLRS